jgi:transcription termination factor NusB
MSGRTPKKAAVPVASRHRAREAAVQMLYQWEVGRLPLSDVRMVWPEVTDEDEPLTRSSLASPTRWPRASSRTSRSSIR